MIGVRSRPAVGQEDGRDEKKEKEKLWREKKSSLKSKLKGRRAIINSDS